jgi:hypothetical protein
MQSVQKMNQYILLVLSLITLNSCKSRSDTICDSNYKYWKLTDKRFRGQIYYYFDNNGKWLVFERHANGEFSKYDGGDVFLIEKWSVKDKGIVIGNDLFKIKYFSKDSISMYNDPYKQPLIITSSDTFYIPKIYNKKM